MTSPSLARRLGLGDAVFIGLGSMIGAGVFSAFAPAAAAAGPWLFAGLAVAASVAFANATSSAQLAAVYPTSGGTYAYGRAVLGPWWGFFAGWSFVIGKTASCAAMALTFAAYAVPEPWQRPVAALAIAALAAVNWFGVTRTALLTRVIVVLVLVALALIVAAVWHGTRFVASSTDAPGGSASVGFIGVLQSAGLLFFAFAGYARIATMGEEVRDPARTIPRAIPIALGITVVVYAVVGFTAVHVLGVPGLAASDAPLADAVAGSLWPWAPAVARIGGALAALGALLALVAGIGRTTLAMAREGDLPEWLAAVHPRWRVPHRAEFALAVVTIALVLLVDLRSAIGFSSFGVLLYYFVANVSALQQPDPQRRWPRWLQVLGAAACLVLVITLPWQSSLAGVGVLAVGVAYRLLRRRAAHA
ncbi:APC family permease [Gryllotalpicola ginsengisoli]|uniref:APC family permease n=1 Tax=Gryllotalpicola ginsengisoli TaxID=444608 RepID=UPI0003B2FE3C|nr:APC family permease [Gryllotalpicola ginsengisoli]